ncbi:GNAT family N-acetyltransferase [Endozoicomonas sp. SM1973]|uniref:GNAT family N-acetyltransferase n=1 Tax=Spartinivicinus marinus TaxID=2994442 RepID=A0A853I7J6_9GAMM|nr:GNAT family N-acetyltransferase [Spartinivicinus marinus]MCX4024980.1 GNAT family N-acetyltransferase [Spartinivicinus marinus]NYZ67672.1 GNAT family N-acetyltransferase [Spartinivicinus marinus]
MDTSLVTGLAAEQLLTNEQFINQWQQLYNQSSIAFSFQSQPYVNSWWQAYHHNYDLAFSLGYHNNQLVACLPLCIRGNQITAAGNHQAEYHAWLTTPEKQYDFLSALVTDIQQVFPDSQLNLKYLPKSLLIHTLEKDSGLTEHLIINNFQRPLMKLNASDIDQALAKESNKNNINQLKSLGELKFTHITEPKAKIHLFKQLAPLYDFYQGAINNFLPFSQDTAKFQFFTTLCQTLTSQLHLTGLWLDEHLVSAQLGFISKNTLHLGILCFAPQYTRYSPSELHLLWLAEQLLQEGYQYLDLTPGNAPWKKQFTNEYDNMVELIYFSNIKHKQKHEKNQHTTETIKRSSTQIGLTSERYHSILSLPHKITSTKALKAIVEQYYCDVELRVYQFKNESNVNAKTPSASPDNNTTVTFNTFNLHDLTKFSPEFDWQSRQQFLTECSQRLEDGEIPYSYVNSYKLLACAWLTPNTNQAYFNEVKQKITFPANSAILHSFYTPPATQAQDLYHNCIQQQVNNAFSEHNAKQLFAVVRADNLSLCQLIEKNSFEYVGSLHYKHHFSNEIKSQQLPDYLTVASS